MFLRGSTVPTYSTNRSGQRVRGSHAGDVGAGHRNRLDSPGNAADAPLVEAELDEIADASPRSGRARGRRARQRSSPAFITRDAVGGEALGCANERHVVDRHDVRRLGRGRDRDRRMADVDRARSHARRAAIRSGSTSRTARAGRAAASARRSVAGTPGRVVVGGGRRRRSVRRRAGSPGGGRRGAPPSPSRREPRASTARACTRLGAGSAPSHHARHIMPPGRRRHRQPRPARGRRRRARRSSRGR